MLSSWFEITYLKINAAEMQAVAIGPSQYEHDFHLNDRNVEMQDRLKILGVILDGKLNFYCGDSPRLKGWNGTSHKAYCLLHLEHCSPLLGIGNGKASKMEKTVLYHYPFSAIQNVSYENLLNIAYIQSLDQRQHFQFLIIQPR